jgi:CrcB protein
MHISNMVAVTIGGGIGALSRAVLCHYLPLYIFTRFPIGIFTVNIIGCFLMGVLVETATFYWSPNEVTRTFLQAGVLGGFTTFSGFALEFGLLMERNLLVTAFLYATLSVISTIFAFYLGIKIIKIFAMH